MRCFSIVEIMFKELIRKKDFYILFVFLVIIMAILASQNFFNIEGVSRYLLDFGYTFSMFFSLIVAITFSAKQIPTEIDKKTIYPLLAKPISRGGILLGKYIGGFCVAVLSYTLFYLVFSFFYVYYGDGINYVLLSQGYFFGVLFLVLMTSIVVFFSTFLTSAANFTISFLLYIIVNMASPGIKDLMFATKGTLSYFYGIIYYLIPHFEFYDLRIRLTHSWDALPFWVIGAVTCYTLIYAGTFFYAATIVFRRRKL